MAVRPKQAEALRAAMRRLLEGRPLYTDGALTWTNVHREAGVSKATSHRAGDLKDEWRRALEARAAATPAPAPPAGPPGPAVAKEETAQALRDTIRTLANHVQALAITVERQEATIERQEATIRELRARLGDGRNLIPLPKRT